MSQQPGVLVNAIVKERDVVYIGQATVFRALARSRPSQAILKQRFENCAGHFAVGQQAFFVLVEIGFLMHLEIVKVRLAHLIAVEQGPAPALRPVAEHLFVQRAAPPLNEAAFVNQTPGKLGQSPAFSENLAVDHLIERDAQGLALFYKNLDMAGDAGIDQLVADFFPIGREQFAMARKKT
jgi:hypothetical protein